MENKKRIEWIDTLRFMGIFSIYLSHLGEQAGYFYPFAYRFQVPLFFFIAGAMENLSSTEESFVRHFAKRFKGIMLPYFFFGLVSIAMIFLKGNANAGIVLKTAVENLLGIRNQLFAPALWFLPCIFVMGMLFFWLKKLAENRWLILIIGIVFFVITITVLPHRPISQPSWFWNIDSVLFYFFYYALGYAVFPYIRRLLSSRSVWAHVGFIVSALAVTFYAMALLAGKDLVALFFRNIPNSVYIIRMLSAVLLIWFNVSLAQVLSSITLFQKIGQDTLFLCGSEQVIRHLTPPLAAIFGLNVTFNSTLGAFIYTFVAIVVAKYAVSPVLKTLYKALSERLYPAWLSAKNTEVSENKSQ